VSLAILHFCFGVFIGVVILVVFRIDPRLDTIVLFASGIWAMMPDVCQVTPITCEQTHYKWWTNVFWFHQVWDNIDPDDTPVNASYMVWVTAAMVLCYTVALLRNIGNLNPAYATYANYAKYAEHGGTKHEVSALPRELPLPESPD